MFVVKVFVKILLKLFTLSQYSSRATPSEARPVPATGSVAVVSPVFGEVVVGFAVVWLFVLLFPLSPPLSPVVCQCDCWEIY